MLSGKIIHDWVEMLPSMVGFRDGYLFRDLDSTDVTVRESLNVEDESWHELIDQRTFRIPEYQRNYSWEKSNRYDFWETLKANFLDLEPLPDDLDDMDELTGMYMGAVYVAEPSEGEDELEIVDGQQRLATFQLLLKTLRDYCGDFKSEAGDAGEFELRSDLAATVADLDAAFSGTDPSVRMNSEDEDFFAILAAHPDSWQREAKEILARKVEEDADVTGKKWPRAKQIRDLIDMIQSPIQTVSNIDLKESQPFAEQEPEEGEEPGEEHESQLDEWVRFETSHERMFNSYSEAYELVENLIEETNGSLHEQANMIMNFTAFVLHSIIVDRCLITGSDPDLRLDIFQSINDKGKPLHNVDKIRARIKHALVGEDDAGPMDEWRSTLKRHGGDKEKIEDMLQYYVAATEDGVESISDAGNALMDVFDRENQSKFTGRLGDDSAELVSEVSTFSKYYLDIQNGEFNHFSRSIDDSSRQDIKRMITRVGDKLGNVTQWYAFVPYVYMKTDQDAPESYDGEDVGQFLYYVMDAVEVLQLRQSISERSGAATEGVYVETVQAFRALDSDKKFESSEVVSDLVSAARSQASELFEDGMIDRMVKNRGWTSKATGQCLLHRATGRYLADRDVGFSIRDFSDVHVEHILPQSPISDRSNRSAAGDPVGEYAWLKYFFRTDQEGMPPISAAVEEVIAEDVSTIESTNLDTSALSEDTDEDEISRILDEIDNRFVDDIGNLMLLSEPDNISSSNDLLSEKLPVYIKDDYIQIVVNDFFNDGRDSPFAASEHIEMTEDDFEQLESDTPEFETAAANRIDRSWNYEIMFERKSGLVYELLQYIEFPHVDADDEDAASPEFGDVRDRVEESVSDDRERRINRRNF
jgi:hypothetical protein